MHIHTYIWVCACEYIDNIIAYDAKVPFIFQVNDFADMFSLVAIQFWSYLDVVKEQRR